MGVGGVGADVGEAFDDAEFVAVVLVLGEVGFAKAALADGPQGAEAIAQGNAFAAVLTVTIIGRINRIRASRVQTVEHLLNGLSKRTDSRVVCYGLPNLTDRLD